jgi:plastocyanin
MKFGVLAAVPVIILSGTAWRTAEHGIQQGAVDTTVVIRSDGPALEFLPARIALKNGIKARIRYVNDGLLPHNIVFPKDENDIDELAAEAASAAATGYVPMGQVSKLFAYARLAKPTETAELVITVPPPGEYRFVCLYPGHQNAMIGTLRSLR